ncbi:hypothetical protein AGMMS5026_06640 [Endomicrobiia bacterium]|nr:site-specific DNA-methyltransferase [Candidatus Endomicrobium trichonymphae]GHT04709.1 hypothetical protein AGMMS49523_02710 [Endomicrobiia bacterium]GHT12002.1 hypothetical protein AGMMS49571_03220 [Endomicrobiia bacterium]GHT20940.1 hypothetical protein AGMMS49929_08750 [Endomicrobiia bacterium]GHT23356.1 hypothetical protein AGMMS49953_03770 [Endomicrobiia bacterium]GHT25999.1 hypothetical protein AGMMS49995_01520 [Endomicrobiia bacterium]
MKKGQWKEDLLKKDGSQMRSVWSIGTPNPSEKIFGKHPTQKPLDLLKRIVLASTEAGDIILDPFTGSSTTGIAAVTNGRMFIGIDKEKRYLELSVKRFENLNEYKIGAAETDKINCSSVQPFLLEPKAKYVSRKRTSQKKNSKKVKNNVS